VFNISIPIWELVVRGVVVYVALLLMLRLTGKRQVGQLAPFDENNGSISVVPRKMEGTVGR
jgi:uncharacterized membrane protein YcaP (DUF421 family)